ncbi:hypothetical protein L1987_11624 [Smallanthus sonchifolius]|uniref:Uncharacterized protein n=1 Tax=Smallanthus sonchifolius TaxID=185202 RepID=A0ACB9JDN0_9ASTR|nr:hypothetical protein L1987_11624 [Smallanthus sonchifolius]
MFYSHQLLARKAPLGQICEEILNPSVPMALRLSGILMGGVVIVYERKVKLLYGTCFVEINEAWKVKPKRDPTILPKGKSQAKYEAVTLPDNQPADLGDFEQHLQFSNSDMLMRMHKTAYINMVNLCNKQIEVTISFDRLFNIKKFDIEGDDVTLEQFPSHNHTSDLPNTLVPSSPMQDVVPSPPMQDERQKPDEIYEQHPENHINHQSDEDKAQHIPQMKRPSRKKQIMIPGHMYQSWLQDASDIVSRRGRKRKHLGSIRSIKIERLMDLPPVALVDGLFTNGNRDIYYPLPLLKQWKKLTKPVDDSTSGETSPPHPPAPPSSSPPEAYDYHDPTTFPFEDHNSGVGSGSMGVSIEKEMPDVNNHEMPEIISTLMNNGINITGANGGPVAEADVAVTPANSDLIVETGPTQTQKVPVSDQPMEQLTDSIRMQLKTHFDTPGSAQTESLNQLALGLDRKKAACLFYHTCGVLLNNTLIIVQQNEPYGNIVISRGAKM